jgi:hypothetical protein
VAAPAENAVRRVGDVKGVSDMIDGGTLAHCKVPCTLSSCTLVVDSRWPSAPRLPGFTNTDAGDRHGRGGGSDSARKERCRFPSPHRPPGLQGPMPMQPPAWALRISISDAIDADQQH